MPCYFGNKVKKQNVRCCCISPFTFKKNKTCWHNTEHETNWCYKLRDYFLPTLHFDVSTQNKRMAHSVEFLKKEKKLEFRDQGIELKHEYGIDGGTSFHSTKSFQSQSSPEIKPKTPSV